MKIKLWGTRGSLASAGPDTVRYGGDTAAVEVLGCSGEEIVLDAGSGIRAIGENLASDISHVDVFLTHLHMDHIQGLGFFKPLFDPTVAVRVWGPGSTTLSLGRRLTRYLSPPLFPVLLRDLPNVTLHEIDPPALITIGGLTVEADLITHPGPTLGFRIVCPDGALAYLPDHEPALGVADFPDLPEWTSGYSLARDVDVLIHDAQFSEDEYEQRVGWGHSTFGQALAFAELAAAKRLVTFHHDPGHSDDMLDRVTEEMRAQAHLDVEVIPGQAGLTLSVE